MNTNICEKMEADPWKENTPVIDRQNISFRGCILDMMLGVRRIRFWPFLPLVIALVVINSTAIAPLQAQHNQTAGQSNLTISKETTFITEPLRKDGSVNYVAALNQRSSQGVTPENNASVLFWKALGPGEISPEYRDKHFQMLGIMTLPEKGDYFIDLHCYISRQKGGTLPRDDAELLEAQVDASDQLMLAAKRPWSQQEFPVLGGWLVANEKPLSQVVEASKRSRRYEPLCCEEKTPLVAVFATDVFHYREVAWALCARAMLRLDEGKLERAWQDLLTCHRLARLVGQGPSVIEYYTASAIEVMACTGDQALLQCSNLSAIQVAKMRKDLNGLSAMPKIAEKLDVAERFQYLDNASKFTRRELALMAGYEDRLGGKEIANTIKSLVRYSASTDIDRNLILRMGNSWFDRLADASSKPNRAAKRKALSKLNEDLRQMKKAAENAESLDKQMLSNPREAFSKRLSQVILSVFFPPITQHLEVEDRWIMQFELDKLSFALAAYRADHGAYPAKLADLVPKYITVVPKDIFNDAELHYKLEGKGYLLYSVGTNGKDDGAKGYHDRKKEEDWDDLVVRVPAPEQK